MGIALGNRGDRIGRLSERDIAALAFIGEGFEVAQYQLHAAIFGEVSETVVSRFVRRAEAGGLIATERLHGFGINRLRLTRRGRGALLAMSVEEDGLFTPAGFVALKDLSHTLYINDLRVVLQTLSSPPHRLLPAWALARRANGLIALVPDLLATWRCDGVSETVLACEIDLGSERLNGVFLPKLRRLAGALPKDQGGSSIVVFTRGIRRMELIRQFGTSLQAPVPILTFQLPAVNGPCGLAELRRMFNADTDPLDKPGVVVAT